MSALSSLSLLALATAATATLAPMAPSVLAGRHAERCGFMADMSHAPVADASTDQQARLDIVETAAEAGSFQTLLAAAEAAGLVDALKADGPLTVFAPTDEAFARLPEGTVDSLLKPENREQLKTVLSYHVTTDRIDSEDLARRAGVQTLSGRRLTVAQTNGTLRVSGARVTTADIECRNGVIHVIDAVMLPASDDLVAIAGRAGSFSTLLRAAEAAGLVDALKADGPITVFAPTDEAFAKLPGGTVDSLLEPENRELLAEILKYHVVPGRVYAVDAIKAGRAETLQGGELIIDLRNGRVSVDNATLSRTDIDASNGVIHVIDRVILPPGM